MDRCEDENIESRLGVFRFSFLRLTDLAVSCKAAHCTTRPNTHGRTHLAEHQGAVRAGLADAPPS